MGLDFSLGAIVSKNGDCQFRVWAPYVDSVHVVLQEPSNEKIPLAAEGNGYFSKVLSNIGTDTLYFYQLNGDLQLPDPASRHQPHGVHGPSQVVSSEFNWTDQDWKGIPLSEYIMYELHVGTYTQEGTFDALIPQLAKLKELGINVIEVMPVAQFPGERNWGYDGVFPFAIQNSYGGPEGLRRFVNAAHEIGIGVVLDVIYNHLGPEGNDLRKFGPYYTDSYKNPWGPAINFDGSESMHVRRFFIENAIYLLRDFHLDGFRLDAIDTIKDFSPYPILEEIADAAREEAIESRREIVLIGESFLNDPIYARSKEQHGYGLHAQWSPDFHHALHPLLTGETNGYYSDFGKAEHVERALQEGFVYTGQYSKFENRARGRAGNNLRPEQYVIYIQNHDQVGNRRRGERLSQLVSLEVQKLAAAFMILSQNTPMLFMGEEYGELSPFHFFVDHSNPTLLNRVKRARQMEFQHLGWPGKSKDPTSEETFWISKLDHSLEEREEHQTLWRFYQELIKIRKEHPAMQSLSRQDLDVSTDQANELMILRRCCENREALLYFHYGIQWRSVKFGADSNRWENVLDSANTNWGGPGSSAPQRIEAATDRIIELMPSSVTMYSKAIDNM